MATNMVTKHFPSLLLLLLLQSITTPTVSSSAAGTETLIGIVGRDFIMLGADSSRGSSGGIALTSSNVDKIVVLNSNQKNGICAAAAAGDAADVDRLLESLKVHIGVRMYEGGMGDDVECVFDGSSRTKMGDTMTTTISENGGNGGLDAEAVAHLARAQIASSLRSYSPLRICMLLAGMVPSSKNKLIPKLYWLDEYGSLQTIKYGCHGYGSNFALSILDRGYKPNMSREDAASLIQHSFDQLRVRYVINSPMKPCVKCVDGEGCTVIAIPPTPQKKENF